MAEAVDIRRASAGPAGLALAVAASLMVIPQAFVIGDLVAAVVLGPASGLTGLSPVALVVALAAIGVARVLADALASHLSARRSVDTRRALRSGWIAAVSGWSPLAGERASAGEVASTIVDRVEAIDPWLARYPIARARLMVVPVAVVLAVLPVSWLVAAILLASGPLLPVLMSLIGSRAREMGRRQLEETAGLTGLLLDRVRGLATLRALGAVGQVTEDIRATGERVRRRTMSILAVAFLSSAVLEFFASVGIALAAIFVGVHLMGWTDFGGSFGLAGGLAVLMLAPEFFQPFRDFAASYHDKATALSLADRSEVTFAPGVRRMMQRSAGPAGAGGGRPVPVTVTGLTVASANGGPAVLSGVDMAVAPGEKVAVVGPSGAGKSTLLYALAGLVADADGEIRIDGRPIGDGGVPPVAWAGQEPFVTQGSVLRNLAFADHAPDRARAAAALDAVGLAEVVARMPRAALTSLGETGAGLSRGELRRLTLARAMLSDSGLLLADEPTADLDAQTASAVTEALLAAAAGRTLVVATHDAALAARMDRIVRIDGGRLVGVAATEGRP